MQSKNAQSFHTNSTTTKVWISQKEDDPTRVTLFLSGNQQKWLASIQQFTERTWHPKRKLWSIPFTTSSIQQLHSLPNTSLHFTFDYKIALQQHQKQKTTPSPSDTISHLEVMNKTQHYAPKSKAPTNIITIQKATAYRLSLKVPYYAKGWIEVVKTIPGRAWDPKEKYWSIPYTTESLDLLNNIGSEHLDFQFDITKNVPQITYPKKPILIQSPFDRLNEIQQLAITQAEERLTLERKSWRTIKSYRNHLIHFFHHYKSTPPAQIDEQQIQNYLLKKIKKQQIAESTHNQIINALKAYFERVLDQQEKVKWIPRPKKTKQLPNILSLQEIELLINSIQNVKHQTMISLIYSAGLRKGEVLNLRIKDLIISRNCIFIKAAKGKKDRFVGLAPTILEMINAYRKIYFPRYWLFEGQKGGQYSETSLQKIFNTAKINSGVNPYVTLHGLRHSYATHLIERGVSLKAIKDLLGHNSIKTTEIYLHLSNEFMKNIQSPIELLNITSSSTPNKH